MSSSCSQALCSRADFPMLQQGVVYFDAAATSLKPQRVIDAISRFYEKQYGTVHRALYSLSLEATTLYAASREEARRFLNAALPEEIVFTKGTTEAINLVAASFGKAFIQPGDDVIISEMEHHSNIVPWQQICKERGAHLKVIPVLDDGTLDLTAYEKLLSPRTKIVSVAHVSNVLGTVNPIRTLANLAHAHGARLFVDGAQAVAHMPVDVQALDADFYAFSGHKAYGPTGIGILYGKKELLEAMPPYQGGGDMIETVTFEATTFQKPPLKFEAGTPNIASVIALKEALRYVETLNRAHIAAYEESLLAYATEKLLTIPTLRIIGTAPHKGAIISFLIEGLHPFDIGTLLDTRGIAVRTGHLCAQPLMRRFGVSALTRASFAPYNTFEEIDQFVAALKSVVSMLRS